MLLVIAEETNEEELPTWDAFYQKMSHLSIEKLPCENYLFKDYPSKTCIEGQISGIILSLKESSKKRIANFSYESSLVDSFKTQ